MSHTDLYNYHNCAHTHCLSLLGERSAMTIHGQGLKRRSVPQQLLSRVTRSVARERTGVLLLLMILVHAWLCSSRGRSSANVWFVHATVLSRCPVLEEGVVVGRWKVAWSLPCLAISQLGHLFSTLEPEC